MVSQSLIVRHATPKDSNKIIDGINMIAQEGGGFHITHFVPSEKWERVLFEPEVTSDHLLYVATLNGQITGVVNLFPGDNHTLFRHVGEMGLFVLKPYRNQGVGKKLLLNTLNWASTAGLEKIVLSVIENNTAAIHLYNKFGFIDEGRRRKQFKYCEQYYDEILMARFL